MKAFYTDQMLILANEQELQLLKVGARRQAQFALKMQNETTYPETRDIWIDAYRSYSKLEDDLNTILNSIPF